MSKAFELSEFGTYVTANSTTVTISANTIISGSLSLASSNLSLSGVVANGSLGTAGQVLTSNGSSVYWSASAGGTDLTSIFFQ